ncbi:MAG: 16S rRNA (adenine(1518)-N(6)/adenine(1519)-N(6))-dimethyltransferase RsmA [Verrucomicrobiota bacterium]
MKLSEIPGTLREIRVTPIKTLGQNFLHDGNLARWIIEKLKLGPDDYAVEIGPGLGALTSLALQSGAQVLAIEKDARLANFLRKRFTSPRLEVLHADALDFDVRTLFAQPRVKCFGNLPYYVSSQLLLKFIEEPSPISIWLFMLQREMARRLSAEPGVSDYGALTLLVQSRYHVEYLRTVPSTVFLPQPEVDSALVQLTPKRGDELPDYHRDVFTRLVRIGFSQRRKQLQKLLRAKISDWAKVTQKIGIGPKARAEELSLAQWIALSNFVRPPDVPDSVRVESERFPVVDEQDRMLATAPRQEVHGDNLRHRAVHILVFNKAGELFLQKRSRKKDRYPQRWDSSAAGHVDAAEEYDQAAHRELGEELGVSANLKRVVKLEASERTGQEFIWLYHAFHEGPFCLAPAEIDYGAFFPTKLVTDWMRARPDEFAPGFIECWKRYLQVDNSASAD